MVRIIIDIEERKKNCIDITAKVEQDETTINENDVLEEIKKVLIEI